jgi:hypothetical protein
VTEIWPPIHNGLSASEQRLRLKAEVQAGIDAGEIVNDEAEDLLACLLREAGLGPRGMSSSAD